MEHGTRSKDERGFSLIELLIAMALASIIATLSLTSYRAYNRSADHRGAAREVVAILRNTQVRAVTEAATYQCVFTATELTIYRDPNIPPTTPRTRAVYSLTEGRFRNNLRFVVTAPNGFTYPASTNPTYPAGVNAPNCFFYARGSATPGTIEVERVDRGTRHSVDLEGLTARVSYAD